MKLKQLFSIFGKIDWRKASPDQQVVGIFSDSRKITAGTVFVATKGVSSDGHDFIAKAIGQGAVALVVESLQKIPDDFNGAVLQVLDSKLAYGELLKDFFQHPEDKLIAFSVTGTNGKTSTSYMIEAILNEADVPCGVMGTIDHHFKKTIWKSDLTTPDTASLFQRLQDFVEAGAKAYVMEVSSHALKQQRVPVQFDVAIFTNFTRDHLDYHQTMEDYWKSKQLLFTEQLKPQDNVFAIVNIDDPQVAQTKAAKHVHKFTFGKNTDADFCFQIKSSGLEGMSFTLTEKSQSYEYQTGMVGEHNVYNLVGSIAAARAWGVPHAICQRAVKKFMGVPGRLQRVPDPKGRHIFIDYAHTPDALEKVLSTLNSVKKNQKLIAVFGCGGDRDQGKRPLMGQVADQFADLPIVTSDNPRSEDPEKIIDGIMAGIKSKKALRESDREKALAKALEMSAAGDVILIAGKGHEDYQIVGDKVLPFSDELVMKKLLQ